MSDRVWIITPGFADEWRIKVVTDLAIACGAQPLRMDARTHDVAVARVSHAAQILASVLAASLLDTPEDHISVAGQGLRDMTRLAASNVGLWTDIVTANAEPIAEVLDEVIGSLQEIRSALRPDSNRGGDAEACAAEIRQVLVKGNDGVARLPGKHGRDAMHFQTVAVMLVDQPGELARLFAAAGTAGINTEDVRIEHILGRPSGLVELFVAPDQAQALRQVLIARGFDVRT
jgi:prephenate dehydrogenase